MDDQAVQDYLAKMKTWPKDQVLLGLAYDLTDCANAIKAVAVLIDVDIENGQLDVSLEEVQKDVRYIIEMTERLLDMLRAARQYSRPEHSE